MTPIHECVLYVSYLMMIFIRHFGILNIARKLNIKIVCLVNTCQYEQSRTCQHVENISWKRSHTIDS